MHAGDEFDTRHDNFLADSFGTVEKVFRLLPYSTKRWR